MITSKRKDIRQLSLSELALLVQSWKLPAFVASQVYEWLWKKSAHSFSEMSNISLTTRNRLEELFYINSLSEDLKQVSTDGTIKVRMSLHDQQMIEGVLIPKDERITACISSQVGCSLSCKFCATGFLERQRNLTAGEIYDQVVLLRQIAQQEYQKSLTNIVLMGMGEPLLNYANVQDALHKICSPEGLNIASKRITLSTAGISKMIMRMADDKVKYNLALSLHAANDNKRNQIMPINASNNLESLVEALLYFSHHTKNEITLEYILLNEFNDTLQDAQELVALCKRIKVKVNLIEYNKVDGVSYKKTTRENRENFVKHLLKNGVIAKVRRSRGKDIDAACGQLANKN